jgi:hypothetical protein
MLNLPKQLRHIIELLTLLMWRRCFGKLCMTLFLIGLFYWPNTTFAWRITLSPR